MADYLNIIYLVIIWFVGWGVYFTLETKWLYFKNKPELTTVYFFALAVIILTSFEDLIPNSILAFMSFFPVVILAVFYTINHFYFILRKNFKEPALLIEHHPHDGWLTANRKALFITSGHILFQQSIITLIILNLHSLGFDLKSVILIFMVIFGAIHLPLILIKDSYFTIMFTIGAVLSAVLFPMMLLNFNFGILINYAIHWMFYVLITFIFWRYQDKIKV